MDTLPELVAHLRHSLDLTAIGQLTLASFLGGIVGIERELNGHPAGLRTNIMIAISSCLFTILSIKAFPLTGNAQDTARVAAQIVTGVGFLGAGAVIQTKRAVHGLTTAATIWMVAAIGMASATSLYGLGIVTTLMTTGILTLLGPFSTWLAAKSEVRHHHHQALYERMVEREKKKAESQVENDHV
ncbi:MAG: MgtC/SapB family protein [Anaerolineales bacterium]|nr:MgtC/SapB family protein [Anaerolineales bacterium]